MDYLTNYYKNLCEELQAKENHLRKLIYEMSGGGGVTPEHPSPGGPAVPPPPPAPAPAPAPKEPPAPSTPPVQPARPTRPPPPEPDIENPNYEELFGRWLKAYQRWWSQQSPEYKQQNPNMRPPQHASP